MERIDPSSYTMHKFGDKTNNTNIMVLSADIAAKIKKRIHKYITLYSSQDIADDNHELFKHNSNKIKCNYIFENSFDFYCLICKASKFMHAGDDDWISIFISRSNNQVFIHPLYSEFHNTHLLQQTLFYGGFTLTVTKQWVYVIYDVLIYNDRKTWCKLSNSLQTHTQSHTQSQYYRKSHKYSLIMKFIQRIYSNNVPIYTSVWFKLKYLDDFVRNRDSSIGRVIGIMFRHNNSFNIYKYEFKHLDLIDYVPYKALITTELQTFNVRQTNSNNIYKLFTLENNFIGYLSFSSINNKRYVESLFQSSFHDKSIKVECKYNSNFSKWQIIRAV